MALVEIAQRVQVNATTIAYEDLFRLSAVLFIVTMPCVLLLQRARGGSARTSAQAET